jgi:hypothetical protein
MEVGMPDENRDQIEKFKKAARELETDDSEEAFDRVLKKVAKVPPSKPRAKEKPDE